MQRLHTHWGFKLKAVIGMSEVSNLFSASNAVPSSLNGLKTFRIEAKYEAGKHT
jgi:hypothetical protein